MKSRILLILFCLGTTASAQQTHLDIKVPDRVESDLFGPVKSTRTVYKKERFVSTSNRHTTRQYDRNYDEKGNLLTSVTIDIDDDTTNTIRYLYNPGGCLTGRVYQASGSKTNKVYSYTIDVPSRQILRVNLSNNDRRVVAYNPAGYEYYIEERDSTNAVEKVVKMKRLANNKEYEFTTFDGEGNHTRTSSFKWNANGLQREYRYQRHGTNETIYTTQYVHPQKDATGNWLKRVAKTERVYKGEKKAYSEEIAVREIEYYDE